jgi:hypothetical protein
MKRSFKKALDSGRKYNPLTFFIERGMSPGEIKEGIIELMSPYFTNQITLEQMAVTVLAPEAINLLKIEDDAWAKAMFTNVLGEYRQAAVSDKTACFEGSANWEAKILHGASEHWSAFYLHADLRELQLEEFKYEVFRSIGVIIEACLQPLLKELLLQVRIRRGKVNPAANLDTLELGLVVGELFDTSGYPELFAPPPWNIRLNQWRNMAQHHKTRIENGLIVGTYGVGSNEKEVRLKQDELFDAGKRISSIFSIVRTARALFLLDNLNEFQPRVGNIDLRADISIFHLASSIAVQGFELVDLSTDGGTAVTAIVKDITDEPAEKRMFHASQFVYPVWIYFPADKVTVEYYDKSGRLILTTVCKGSDCEEVSQKVIAFEELSNRVEFTLAEDGNS